MKQRRSGWTWNICGWDAKWFITLFEWERSSWLLKRTEWVLHLSWVRVRRLLASKSIASVAVVKGGIWFSMAFAGECDGRFKWATTASFQIIALSSFIVIVLSDSLIWLLFCKKGTHKILILQEEQETGSVLRITDALRRRISPTYRGYPWRRGCRPLYMS